ncbi:hypothetical protein COP2_026984 [Malus domestica]
MFCHIPWRSCHEWKRNRLSSFKHRTKVLSYGRSWINKLYACNTRKTLITGYTGAAVVEGQACRRDSHALADPTSIREIYKQVAIDLLNTRQYEIFKFGNQY